MLATSDNQSRSFLTRIIFIHRKMIQLREQLQLMNSIGRIQRLLRKKKSLRKSIWNPISQKIKWLVAPLSKTLLLARSTALPLVEYHQMILKIRKSQEGTKMLKFPCLMLTSLKKSKLALWKRQRSSCSSFTTLSTFFMILTSSSTRIISKLSEEWLTSSMILSTSFTLLRQITRKRERTQSLLKISWASLVLMRSSRATMMPTIRLRRRSRRDYGGRSRATRCASRNS